jgi:hypothetical protein
MFREAIEVFTVLIVVVAIFDIRDKLKTLINIGYKILENINSR